MEVSLTPETQAKLDRAALQAGKPAGQLLEELIANYLEHDLWFRQEVEKGLASLDQGKWVSREDVRRQMKRILKSK